MDGPLLVAAKLVPSWNPSATEADPLSILNIFNRRQKGECRQIIQLEFGNWYAFTINSASPR